MIPTSKDVNVNVMLQEANNYFQNCSVVFKLRIPQNGTLVFPAVGGNFSLLLPTLSSPHPSSSSPFPPFSPSPHEQYSLVILSSILVFAFLALAVFALWNYQRQQQQQQQQQQQKQQQQQQQQQGGGPGGTHPHLVQSPIILRRHTQQQQPPTAALSPQ